MFKLTLVFCVLNVIMERDWTLLGFFFQGSRGEVSKCGVACSSIYY